MRTEWGGCGEGGLVGSRLTHSGPRIKLCRYLPDLWFHSDLDNEQ